MASYPHQAAAGQSLITAGSSSTTVANQQLVLEVKEMGNRFTVTDVATKRTFMHSKPKYPSFRRRMNVYDGNEKLLFDIIQPPFHMIHPTFSIQGQDKAELMRVRFGATKLNRKASATFTTAAGQTVKLTMKTDWKTGSAKIVQEPSGGLVAQIKRKLDSKGAIVRRMAGQDTYTVTVQRGVDAALIVAMCICWDTKKEQQKQ